MVATSIRVLTYNLCNEQEGERAVRLRFKAIAAAILDAAPDVVCLQEVPDTNTVVELAGLLVEQQRRAMFMALTKLERTNGWVEYLAIIHPGTRHTATRYAAPGGERIALSLTLSSAPLTVISAHLDPHTAEARRVEAEGLLAGLHGEGAIVIGGGLNADDDGGLPVPFRDRLATLAPASEGSPTFPTALRSEQSGPGVRDYILGSGVKTVALGLIGLEPIGGIVPSDHAGVWADIELA
jgi:endonuclease/exonuclease/phosphatase family metal-dependent hydrolase